MKLTLNIFFFIASSYTLCFVMAAQGQDSLSRWIPKESQTPSYYQRQHNEFKSHTLTPAIADDPLAPLQGQIPGLLMLKSGGDPMQSFSIRAHGISSAYGNNQPQIWIDGFPADDLSLLRQEDIDSIAVLQDAASTAMYGQGAASGVILIKTKTGKKSGFSAAYQTGASIGTYAKRPTVLEGSAYRERGGFPFPADFAGSTNWQDEMIQSPFSNTHHLFLTQNNKNCGIKATGGYQLREGLLKNSNYNQLNGRVHAYANLWDNKVKINGGWAGGQKKAEPGFVEAMRYATTFNPLSPIKDDDPAFNPYGGYANINSFDYYNPVAILEQNKNFKEKTSLMGFFGAAVHISPRFTIAAHLSSRSVDQKIAEYYPEQSLFRGEFSEKARLSIIEQTHLYSDLVATYNLKTSSANWIFNAAWIQNQENNVFKYREGRDIEPKNSSPGSLDDIFNLNLSDAITNGLSVDRDIDKNNSGFLASFSMDKRLFALQGGIRTLSANGTAPNRPKSLILPFLSAQWGKPSFRLLANFGQSANQQFDYYIESEKRAYYGKKTAFTLGFSSRLKSWQFEAQYFLNQSKDLLQSLFLFGQPAFFPVDPKHSATIQNGGLSLGAKWNVIEKSAFSWTIDLNINTLNSKVKAFLPETINPKDYYVLASTGGPGQGDVFYQRIYNGSRIGEFWTGEFSGIDANGIVKVADKNNNGFQDRDDDVKKGSGLPSRWLAIQNQIQINRFELDFRFRAMGGYRMINENALFYTGKPFGQNNSVVTENDDPQITYNTYNDRLVEKTSFVRLDLLQMGYKFKLNKVGLKFAVGTQNLFTLSTFSGNDPEPVLEDPGSAVNGSYLISPLRNSLSPGIERRHNYWPEKNYFLRLMAEF